MKVYFEKGITVINTGDPIGNSSNATGCAGVSWHKKRNGYEAKIGINRIQFFLGFFTSLEDAIAIRKEAEKHRDDGTFYEWHQSLYDTVKQHPKGSASK